ncbi:MAG: metal-dependent hydrolase [Burkholderiaceae bacterium]
MDSVTQFTLGAAVGVAVMGRHAPRWKSALWGAVCGTLPDLDVFVDRGDPIRDMILHRTESHAVFYLTLVSPLIAVLISAIHRDRQFGRWWLAVWIALITHPLLDLMTVYGTQIALPFTATPYYIGSVFVIDPVVTILLLAGVVAAVIRGAPGLRSNAVGLGLACAYLAWGVGAQAQARDAARDSLAHAGVAATGLLVTPTAFNTVLWRIVAMTPDVWYEGSWSFLDPPGDIVFVGRPTGRELFERHADDWHVQRLAWFSHGFFDVAATPAGLRLRDLRMGYGDAYTFTFTLPHLGRDSQNNEPSSTAAVIRQTYRVDIRAALPWLWHRMGGEVSPFPANEGRALAE